MQTEYEAWLPRFADFSRIVYLRPTCFSFFPIQIPETPDPMMRTLKSVGATIFSTPRSLLNRVSWKTICIIEKLHYIIIP